MSEKKTSKVYLFASLSVVVGVGIAGGVMEYLHMRHEYHLQELAIERQKEYASLMQNAESDAKNKQLPAALQAIAHAIAIESSSKAAQILKHDILSVQGHYLGINGYSVLQMPSGLIKNNPGYGVYIKSVIPNSPAQKAALQSGDILLAGAYTQSGLNDIGSGFANILDLEALIDKTPVGQQIFLEVQDHSGNKNIISAQVGAAPSGMYWVTGAYQQLRFGDSATLPTLYQDGIPFGWEPISSAGGDGSGREFVDPLDKNVTVSIYGMNNPSYAPLTSNVPASAQIVNNSLSIGNAPGIEFKDLETQHGVNVVSEGIVVGSSKLPAMNGIIFTVPESELSNWQPIINQTMNSFTPGDLMQIH